MALHGCLLLCQDPLGGLGLCPAGKNTHKKSAPCRSEGISVGRLRVRLSSRGLGEGKKRLGWLRQLSVPALDRSSPGPSLI